MVEIINIITFVIGLMFLLNGYYLVKKGKEDLIPFLMSAAVGAGLIVVAVYPDIFDSLAKFLGFEIKGRAILVVSNLTLFVVVTYLFSRIGELKKEVSKLNEDLSLLNSQMESEDEE
jgi:hypothetical protein